MTLVDRAMVNFLATYERKGIELRNGPEMVRSIFCMKYEAQGLLSSNHGKPFFGRRGWNTGWHRSFPDRFRDGLRGRILSCESSQRRWFLLEFLRSEHFRHYAYPDAARRMHPLLERS